MDSSSDDEPIAFRIQSNSSFSKSQDWSGNNVKSDVDDYKCESRGAAGDDLFEIIEDDSMDNDNNDSTQEHLMENIGYDSMQETESKNIDTDSMTPHVFNSLNHLYSQSTRDVKDILPLPKVKMTSKRNRSRKRKRIKRLVRIYVEPAVRPEWLETERLQNDFKGAAVDAIVNDNDVSPLNLANISPKLEGSKLPQNLTLRSAVHGSHVPLRPEWLGVQHRKKDFKSAIKINTVKAIVNDWITRPDVHGSDLPTTSTHVYEPRKKHYADVSIDSNNAEKESISPYFDIVNIEEQDREATITERLKLPSNEVLESIHSIASTYYSNLPNGHLMLESLEPGVLLAFGILYLTKGSFCKN